MATYAGTNLVKVIAVQRNALTLFWWDKIKFSNQPHFSNIYQIHCKPIPVMKTGFSLCTFSHREKPVFITRFPGDGNRCWEKYTGKTLFSLQGWVCSVANITIFNKVLKVQKNCKFLSGISIKWIAISMAIGWNPFWRSFLIFVYVLAFWQDIHQK